MLTVSSRHRAARLLAFVLLVAQLLQLSAAAPPVRAATPAQVAPPAPPAPVESTPAPQPAISLISALAAAVIPAHLDEPALQTEVLVIANPSVSGQEGLWRYIHPHGWVKQPLPVANWVWFGIAASPFDPDYWLLWGQPNGGSIAVNGSQLVGKLWNESLSGSSPLWRATDAGRTWINVGLSAPPTTQSTLATSVPPRSPWAMCRWKPTRMCLPPSTLWSAPSPTSRCLPCRPPPTPAPCSRRLC